MVDACPWVEVIKRSACIEGARRALARAKVHWGRLDAERLLTDAPPAGKEYRTPEMYYKSVLKGVRESWTRGCPDSRTTIIGRTPRL